MNENYALEKSRRRYDYYGDTCDVTIWFPTTFSARHGLGPGSKPTIDIVTGNNPLKCVGRATRLLHTADPHPTLVRQTESQRIVTCNVLFSSGLMILVLRTLYMYMLCHVQGVA